MTSKNHTKIITANCPDCKAAIEFPRRPKPGQWITCQECNAWLEVIAELPVKLVSVDSGNGLDW